MDEKNRQTSKDSLTKDEFEKKKQEILTDIERSIDEDGTFVYLSKNKDEQTVMMGGTFAMMSFIIASAMNQSEEVRKIVEVAVESFKHASEQHDEISNFAKFMRSRGFGETFANIMKDFKKQVDCETCESQDTCEIFQHGEDCPSGQIDLMEKLLKEKKIKPRGEA